MKKSVLALVAVFAVTSVMAQTKSTTTSSSKDQKKIDPTEMVTKRTEEMVSKYNLTTEQAAKLKTLNEKYMGKQGAPKDKNSSTEKPSKPTSTSKSASTDKTAQKKATGTKPEGPDMTAYNTELKAILTDDQYKAYETEMANQKKNKDNKSCKGTKSSKSSKSSK